jgi:hypothetical protein
MGATEPSNFKLTALCPQPPPQALRLLLFELRLGYNSFPHAGFLKPSAGFGRRAFDLQRWRCTGFFNIAAAIALPVIALAIALFFAARHATPP